MTGKGSIMPGRLTRRRLFQLSGASAATGGLAAILASGRAPAYAQGTTVHWLKFVDFVPVSDQLIKGKIKDECQKALGISLPCRDDRRQRHPSPHDLRDP